MNEQYSRRRNDRFRSRINRGTFPPMRRTPTRRAIDNRYSQPRLTDIPPIPHADILSPVDDLGGARNSNEWGLFTQSMRQRGMTGERGSIPPQSAGDISDFDDGTGVDGGMVGEQFKDYLRRSMD